MKTKAPAHIGIIMDGNGRWAKKRGLPRSLGHREGMNRVIDIVKLASDFGCKYLTLYAFSTENWKRPEEEVSALMNLLIKYVENELKILIKENIRIKILGEQSVFPKAVKISLEKAIDSTKNNTGMILNLALNYGGRSEIVRAFKNIKKDNVEISEDTVSKYLYTSDIPDPDFLIRTGGEKRLSNFLLYQIAYTELYFTDILWPDFREKEFKKAINEFNKRNRRFGDVR